MVLARDGADTANAAARTAGAKLILERMMSLLSQLPSLQVRQTLGSTAFRKSMTSMASNDRQRTCSAASKASTGLLPRYRMGRGDGRCNINFPRPDEVLSYRTSSISGHLHCPSPREQPLNKFFDGRLTP